MLDLVVVAPPCSGVGGAPGSGGTSSIHPPAASMRYVFGLFAFQSARASVVSVKQPTETLLRTTQGTSASAQPREHDADDEPRPLLRRPTRNAQQTSGRKSSRVLPRIASAERRRRGRAPSQSDAPLGQRASVSSTIAAASELVEDLAVHVDVVPDEVRVQRRDARAAISADPLRDEPPPDLVDEQRGRDRDHDLDEPDRPPRAAEDPVDRDQEPRVERLRPRRRLARDEPERAGLSTNDLREVVALLGERREDVAALVRAARPAAERAADERDDQPGAAPVTRATASRLTRGVDVRRAARARA